MTRSGSVGILFHAHVDTSLPVLQEARRVLEGSGVRLWEVPREAGARELRAEMAGTRLILTLGGDGTFLYGARVAAPNGIPLLGVNLGRLGFLTELEADDLVLGVERFLRGDFRLEERSLLEAVVIRGGKRVSRTLCMNEVVVQRAHDSRLIRLDMSIDGQEVGTIDADGVVVATATGSTAYSLALGGPILEPSLENLVVVPMAPFALTVRPIVCAPREALVIALPRTPALMVADGSGGRRLQMGDRVVVRLYEKRLRVVRFSPPQRFYRVLRQKLGWGSPLVPYPELTS